MSSPNADGEKCREGGGCLRSCQSRGKIPFVWSGIAGVIDPQPRGLELADGSRCTIRSVGELLGGTDGTPRCVPIPGRGRVIEPKRHRGGYC